MFCILNVKIMTLKSEIQWEVPQYRENNKQKAVMLSFIDIITYSDNHFASMLITKSLKIWSMETSVER